MFPALITLAAAGAALTATADLGVSFEPNRYLAVGGAGTEIQAEARVINLGPDDAPSVVLVLRVTNPGPVSSPMRSGDVRCSQEQDEALRCQLGTVPANGPPKIIRFSFRGHPGGAAVAEISGAVTDGMPDNDVAQGAVFEAPPSGGGGGCRAAGGGEVRAEALAVVLVLLGLGGGATARATFGCRRRSPLPPGSPVVGGISRATRWLMFQSGKRGGW